MQNLINEINKRLDSLDFNKLWKGFIRYDYALYNDENVYFDDGKIESVDNRFLGNTSIENDGRYIAIWRITEDTSINIDVLTACIVHEMFHAHQFTCNQEVFTDEFEGLRYPYNLENYKLRYKECMLLVDALKEKDLKRKSKLFNNFVMTRLKREKIINDLINYETGVETAEGCAEYVCMKALKELCYKDYEKRLEDMCSKLCVVDESIFDIRRTLYFTGVLECMIAEELGKDIFSDIGESDICIFDRIINSGFEVVSEDGEDDHYDSNRIEQLFNDYVENIKDSINLVLTDKRAKKEEGKFSVIGFDPMNMVRYDNMVLHKRFVFLLDGNEKRFIKGPVIAFSESGDFHKCESLVMINE